MRKLILPAIAFAIAMFVAGEASAFKASVSQVRTACSAAGGTFGVHQDGRGYGCVKKNCDGKGGDCSVHCDNNNNCDGSTPSFVAGSLSIKNVLSNGVAVQTDGRPKGVPGSILGSSSGFATQNPSAAGSPMTPPKPSAPPPPQIR